MQSIICIMKSLVKVSSSNIALETELQIRGGIKDNQRFFSYFSLKTYVVTPHLNRLSKTVLMRVHKMFLLRNMANYS